LRQHIFKETSGVLSKNSLAPHDVLFLMMLCPISDFAFQSKLLGREKEVRCPRIFRQILVYVKQVEYGSPLVLMNTERLLPMAILITDKLWCKGGIR